MDTIPKTKCTVKSWESDSKRPCLPVYKKTGWEADPRPIEDVQAVTGRKTRGRCEPQSQLPVNILSLHCYFTLLLFYHLHYCI